MIDPRRLADRLYWHRHSRVMIKDGLLTLNEPRPIVDPSHHADTMYCQHWHSHDSLVDCNLNGSDPIVLHHSPQDVGSYCKCVIVQHSKINCVVDRVPSFFDTLAKPVSAAAIGDADRPYLFAAPNELMPAVHPSCLADRQYRHHHLHGESTTTHLSFLPSI